MTADRIDAAALAGLPLLAGFGDAFLRALAGAAERRKYEAGSGLFAAGDRADRLYVVERGQVALRADRGAASTIVMTVGPGDLLGWLALRDDARWLTSAIAVGAVTAITIPSDAILDRLAAGGGEARVLARRLFGVAADHLGATQSQLLGVGNEGIITGG